MLGVEDDRRWWSGWGVVLETNAHSLGARTASSRLAKPKLSALLSAAEHMTKAAGREGREGRGFLLLFSRARLFANFDVVVGS